MEKKKLKSILYTSLVSLVLLSGVTGVGAMDNIGSGSSGNGSETVVTTTQGDGGSTGNALSDALVGYDPVNAEDVRKAQESSAWGRELAGWLISVGIIFTAIGIGVITMLDLMYIAIPPVRGLLYRGGNGMPGLQPSDTGGGNNSFQIISDEALAVVSQLGDGGGAAGNAAYGMPAAGGVQSNKANSKIAHYMSLRIGFLVVFGICSVLLFTSSFTDFGIHVGGLIIDILVVIMEKIQNFRVGG